MRKTMRKVTIVVAVLITSCHVVPKPKIGPVTSQMTMSVTAAMKARGWPVERAVRFANRSNGELRYIPAEARPGSGRVRG
jgi:hypothetical protein